VLPLAKRNLRKAIEFSPLIVSRSRFRFGPLYHRNFQSFTNGYIYCSEKKS
jgi:hypothetical protein